MGAVNLSPARLAVLVALVVGGLAILLNGFGDQAVTAAGSSGSPTPAARDDDPDRDRVPDAERVAGPGARAAGRGGRDPGAERHDRDRPRAEVEQLLVGRGYVAGLPAGDADNKPVGTTTVYFRTGADADQNEVDAENLARRYLKGVEADVRPLNATLSPDIAPKTQLVVIVGTDYADAQAAA